MSLQQNRAPINEIGEALARRCGCGTGGFIRRSQNIAALVENEIAQLGKSWRLRRNLWLYDELGNGVCTGNARQSGEEGRSAAA